MILLVPLSFGFTLMMIHLAKDAERKAKLANDKWTKEDIRNQAINKMDKLVACCLACVPSLP